MIIEKHKQLNPNPEGVTLCKLQPYKHIKEKGAENTERPNTERQNAVNAKCAKGIAAQRTAEQVAKTARLHRKAARLLIITIPFYAGICDFLKIDKTQYHKGFQPIFNKQKYAQKQPFLCRNGQNLSLHRTGVLPNLVCFKKQQRLPKSCTTEAEETNI